MSDNDLWSQTAIRQAGVQQGSSAAEAIALRANVMEMTQVAEDAVLTPAKAGAWSHSLRAALAARIAAHSDLPDLSAQYAAKISDDRVLPLCDLDNDGTGSGLSRVITFVDDVAKAPRDIRAEDIADLQAAGVRDADIVRLAELNAFIAYQVRLIAGLKLLAGAAA